MPYHKLLIPTRRRLASDSTLPPACRAGQDRSRRQVLPRARRPDAAAHSAAPPRGGRALRRRGRRAAPDWADEGLQPPRLPALVRLHRRPPRAPRRLQPHRRRARQRDRRPRDGLARGQRGARRRVLSHRRVTGGRNERRGTGPLWTAAVLLPVLCCAALPLLVAAGTSAGIALLVVGVTLGALVLGV